LQVKQKEKNEKFTASKSSETAAAHPRSKLRGIQGAAT
jgi:hypothetical protein